MVARLPNYKSNLEMIYDCVPNDIMVIETNTKNIYMHDTVGRRLALEFPQVIKALEEICFNSGLIPGKCYLYKVDGIRFFAILVTHTTPIRKDNLDDPETVEFLLRSAIHDMINKVGKNQHYVSGFLGKRFKAWGSVHNYIKEHNLNWSVYTG